jgi:hypothetical protein
VQNKPQTSSISRQVTLTPSGLGNEVQTSFICLKIDNKGAITVPKIIKAENQDSIHNYAW